MFIYLFWLAFGFIVYTYFLYPIIIWLLSSTRATVITNVAGIHDWPEISIIIPVYNELNVIDAKIKNILSLDYPSDRINLIVVSDGSNDGLNDILQNDTRIDFIFYEQRQGKPTALNTAIDRVTTDIVVFTDVRQELDVMALKYLVTRICMPGIGAVSGELCHKVSTTNIGKNVGLYWQYEKWIRKSESRYYSTAGVTGALYAIHTKNYSKLRKNTLLDDFEVPMKILRCGLRVVLENQAKVYDVSQEDIAAEKKRKIRTLTGNFQSFAWNTWLFVPWLNPIIFQFLSHKVFRLMVPYAMLITLFASYFSTGAFYLVMFWLQVLFYLLGLTGMFSNKIRNIKFVSVIVVFIELNVSAVFALKKFIMGDVKVQWDKT